MPCPFCIIFITIIVVVLSSQNHLRFGEFLRCFTFPCEYTITGENPRRKRYTHLESIIRIINKTAKGSITQCHQVSPLESTRRLSWSTSLNTSLTWTSERDIPKHLAHWQRRLFPRYLKSLSDPCVLVVQAHGESFNNIRYFHLLQIGAMGTRLKQGPTGRWKLRAGGDKPPLPRPPRY